MVGKLVAGLGLIGVSLFMLLGFFLSAPVSVPVAVLTFIVSVVIPGGAGVALLVARRRGGADIAARREALRLATLEAEVLALAGRRGGRLAAIEVAADIGVTTDAAEDVLRSLSIKGVAEPMVTDKGLVVYDFPDVHHLVDKGGARGVLDA
jgi:hypothetical protein